MMNATVFMFGLVTAISPALAYYRDIGWDDTDEDFVRWMMGKRLDQLLLMRGMMLAGFLLMGASVLWEPPQ
jgi:hypothetical protein